MQNTLIIEHRDPRNGWKFRRLAIILGVLALIVFGVAMARGQLFYVDFEPSLHPGVIGHQAATFFTTNTPSTNAQAIFGHCFTNAFLIEIPATAPDKTYIRVQAFTCCTNSEWSPEYCYFDRLAILNAQPVTPPHFPRIRYVPPADPTSSSSKPR